MGKVIPNSGGLSSINVIAPHPHVQEMSLLSANFQHELQDAVKMILKNIQH